ncbi:Tryptophan synthase beta subunit-like PLP-dependent enzymes superfamily [Penicillium angulare]|uniref:Tryptophan synthase beta subunit-like PLP-dependent enzymes superfamily n=1 Tax=Penicillium angulare TaxID=116970 RepID=UPI00253FDEDF|nr:Tryptophan synthase beta subunit-like PLP-dependent enzymes superfamily [Penicillium angulare]KAJ5291003.1 Tryptophan synthase beta subunit-like PLP-dependent enzymes superfamily [Penicillium angulare]
MPDRSAIYVGTAFVAGVCLTIAYKDILDSRRNEKSAKPKPQSDALVAHSGPPEIVEGIEGCIGNTHLFRIKSLSDETGCEILAKAEARFLNGAGQSSKDRVALSMIELAEEEGILTPYSGDTIYEGTSGSTGISLASLARAKGYLAHICLPSDQAIEKSNLLLKLGAIVDRVPPAPIVEKENFINRARALAAAHTGSTPVATEDGEVEPSERMARGRGFFADQFENEANWRAHYDGSGPEIYAQCNGKIDAFVAGAGTGGTISGVARYLKPLLPDLTVVLADPQGSGLYNRVRYGVMFDVKEREGTRRRRQVDTIVEGIGVNRVTANFEAGKELIDDAVRVTDAQALAMARWLVEKDGIFAGSSSAVNCFAAVKTAQKLGPGHRIVTMLSDSGSRHLSRFWAKAGDVGGAVDTKLSDVLNARDEDFQ